MPKLLRSIYAGGYSDEKKRRLQSVKLPPKIKCAGCHKLKAVNFFSTIQQLELQNGIATGQVGNAAVEEWVPCVSCTPKQVTELECCICEEVKDLSGFAKAQRRLGENAKCIPCVIMLNGETPHEGGYMENVKARLKDSDSESEYSTSNAHENSTFGETESSAGVALSSVSGYDFDKEDLSSLSLSNNHNSQKPSTNASGTTTKRSRVPKSANDWQNFAKENNGHVGSSKGPEYTGYDRDGNAHRMVRPASTVASDDDSDDTIADPRERARLAKEEREARSRFAKVPGGRDVPVAIPTYVSGKQVPKYKNDFLDDDDDDDDDDWGTI